MNLYDGNGTMIPVGGNSSSSNFPWFNINHAGKAPEEYGNSIYSLERTHEYGEDGAEIDLRMTADNVIVLSHNSEITGTDENGDTQTMTIISNTYDDLKKLTLFTIDGVDYHLVNFESAAKMMFYWGWKIVQLDFKSQANTNACRLKGAEIIVKTGLSGRAMYITGSSSQAEDILAIDPYAMFSIGKTTDITGTILETLPKKQVWRVMEPSSLATFVRDAHPIYVTNAGPPSADLIFSYQPNAVQWQRDTDGASLSETYLANLQWT